MNPHVLNPILNPHVQQQPLVEYQSLSQLSSEPSSEHQNPSTSSNDNFNISENVTPNTVHTVSESVQSLNATMPRSMIYTPPSTITEVSGAISGGLQSFDGGNSNKEAPLPTIDKEESIVSPENVREFAVAHKDEHC